MSSGSGVVPAWRELRLGEQGFRAAEARSDRAVAARDGGAAEVASVDGLALLGSLVGRRRGALPRGSHRALALSEAMGSPHLSVPAIHVAGTNGKTSVVRMVASLLTALGIRVGDTTSPHLHHLAERIRIDGRPVDPALLRTVCEPLPSALVEVERRTGEHPTFFDTVTVSALRSFEVAQVPVAVVEAGIGGSGDATNIVQGRVAVLTRIGLDHAELGADHAAVAAEKAGIVEPGAVVVSARQEPAAAAEIARACAARGATLLASGDGFEVVRRRPTRAGQIVELRGLGGDRLRAHLPLHGAPQAANAALALAAVQALLGTDDLDPQRLQVGFASVRVPGRMEVIRMRGCPEVILDGAHDAEAVAALATTVGERLPAQRPNGERATGERATAGRPSSGGRLRRVAVFGLSGQRDAVKVLAPLAAMLDTVVVVTANTPSVRPAAEVSAELRSAGHHVVVVDAIGPAMDVARAQAGPAGLVVVTGSLHVVAEARNALGVGSSPVPGSSPASAALATAALATIRRARVGVRTSAANGR